MTEPRKKNEVLDQSLHAGWAILKMLAFVLPMGVIIAAFLTMVEAIVRELEQHEWDFRRLGWFDLTFWFVGVLIFIAGYYMAISILGLSVS